MGFAYSDRRFLGHLTGELCAVRDTERGDISLMVRWRNDSRAAFFDSREVTEQSTDQFIQTVDGYLLTITLPDGRPCGFTSIYNIDDVGRIAEMGRTMLAADVRGQGIVQEAYHLLLAYIFKHTRIEKLWSTVRLDNGHLSEGVGPGWEIEGIQRQHWLSSDGRLQDAILVGLCKERYLKHFDWRTRRYDEPDALADLIGAYLNGG